ncbi:MAG: type II toxin-antitoxin system VapC family toxin [Nitrospirae bacterium]|nr:type II toxin-antitoxin system VapC family toxin [Nitrospirota bacterium]
MESHRKVVIDTNLLVRYLTGDDSQKAKAVDNLLIKAEKGELKIFIPSIVIAELVWVLESFYQMYSSEIAELVEAVLHTPGIEVTEKSIIASALKLYRTKNIDLIDTWIIEFAKDRGIKTIYTFDKKHFMDVSGIETKSP